LAPVAAPLAFLRLASFGCHSGIVPELGEQAVEDAQGAAAMCFTCRRRGRERLEITVGAERR